MKTKRIRAYEAARSLKKILGHCTLCPRRCGVDRLAGKTGYCRAGSRAVIYSYGAHHGEEPPISGSMGSGTIFFSGCTMKCAYCQNYTFSQHDKGEVVDDERLAGIMLGLQAEGCHNINLVSPTHYLPQILNALAVALDRGLSVPIVYNTSGYESVDTLRALEGIVDIYLPDMRYADNAMGMRYSGAPDYVERDREAVVEMQRQAGDLVMRPDGIARQGVIIRLLVLPGGISGTEASLGFIKRSVSPNAWLSIMSQYYPAYRAVDFPELARGVSPSAYQNVIDEAALLGLNNGWIQEIPDEPDPRFRGTTIRRRPAKGQEGLW